MKKGDRILYKVVNTTVFSVVVLGSLYLFLFHAYAAQQTDTVTISVNVSQLTLVDINPANLTWGSGTTVLNPGSVGDSSKEANGYENIWIENIGSTNITHIWFNNSYESSIPFGTGNPAAYDPANMVTISNGSSPYQFINRVEYNESDYMYLTLPASWSAFGRLRNATQEWFWALVPNTDCSDGTIYISTSAKTVTDTGDTDLTDNSYTLNQVGSEGIVNVTVGGEHYCVIVPSSCSYVKFSRWNYDEVSKHASCANDPVLASGYYYNGALVPGAVTKAWVHVHVPYGVPYGEIGSTQTRKLTVIVNDI